MSIPEMDDAYGRMAAGLRNRTNDYLLTLQHRYGDPRVYAMQEQQMRADTAAMQFNAMKNEETALRSAYETQRATVRNMHEARMGRSRKPTRSSKAADGPDQTSSPPA